MFYSVQFDKVEVYDKFPNCMVYHYSLHKSQSYNCYTESDTVCCLSFNRLYCIETLCWLQEKTNIL